MRAFLVAGRALRSSGRADLPGRHEFAVVATGGVAAIAATLIGYPLAMMNGPWWLAAAHHADWAGHGALAVVARRCAVDLR